MGKKLKNCVRFFLPIKYYDHGCSWSRFWFSVPGVSYRNATDLASAAFWINSLISFVEKEWNRAPGLFLHAGYGRSKRRPARPLNERVLVWLWFFATTSL